ncbi:DUF4191 domain-containing protein [Rothia nasimurium]|uniref:DUF4191 domain-containing protein n=1 Tax=Rothia nasimurium TaxID=85336 RepID=UPI001F2E7358|nr:DUF4191 domain-containing protein [Rothia nasimurium]
MAESRGSTRAQTREEKKKAREERRAKRGPGMFAQMKQVYAMTREQDPNIPWILALVFFGTVLVFLLIGLLLNNWITFLLIGIPLGVLFSVMVLSRRAEKAAFAQLEGQPGRSGAALSTLRRGWIFEQQPVAANKSQDIVFRAIGRPGIVLVTEGPTGRVNGLVQKEKLKYAKIVPTVPVTVINTGHADGQVELKQLTKTMNKLPKKLTQQEMHQVANRIDSLSKHNNMLNAIPKGIDPMRMRPDRRGMR